MKIKKEDELLLNITKIAFNDKQLESNDYSLLNIDWEELLRISLQHKIFPILYKYILPFVPVKYQALYDQHYYSMTMMIDMYMQELKRINLLAFQNNIKIILLKGFSLSKMIYDDKYFREFSDIDLLLNENEIEKMYYLLHDIGYEQYAGYDEDLKKVITCNTAEIRGNRWFHELKCIKIIGEKADIDVEIKRASSAIPLNHIADFLSNTQTINLSDFQILSTNLTYSLLHLCANFYNDSESLNGGFPVIRLRDLLDIAIFLKKYKSIIKWNEIFELSVKYEITHKIYLVSVHRVTNFQKSRSLKTSEI